ncbi:site-specific integrase [Paraburkholderia sp. CNPSo 3274]|uniref:tyrosine-type recombinase/integrase n=1 Tax=unclassified Paraburkholderia TaxID=2615204 RepID=UPI0020B78863|nr:MULTISPECIES: tyrosine-type recombinase/integrase [unclassified Paraburkholderia]MCP3713489.1 site-specific integrase [Paraburkholderia sp. CNPSo 3274]MCP3721249.1 site-specific integrase [Paraburkholderia sp. CNPSo 3281]
MSHVTSQPQEFASLLQRFFIERLMQQQNASPRTVESYRDTFRMLLTYAQQALHKPPEKFTLNELDVTLITAFLDNLDTARSNSIRSRNARLSAIRTFYHYVTMRCPQALHLAQQILSIPTKRFERPLLGFLSREEVHALLDAPDADTWFGQRDRLLLALLYNTGARVSELTGMRVADVTLAATPWVRLHGKGRKQRAVPLWRETAAAIRHWIREQGLQPEQPLLPSRHGGPMTRANVAERFSLALTAAGRTCPSLMKRHITPHSMRHTVATHLLQAGVGITEVALWLGHESPVTTHGYVEADQTMKRRALATVKAPGIKMTFYRPSDSLLKFLESL